MDMSSATCGGGQRRSVALIYEQTLCHRKTPPPQTPPDWKDHKNAFAFINPPSAKAAADCFAGRRRQLPEHRAAETELAASGKINLVRSAATRTFPVENGFLTRALWNRMKGPCAAQEIPVPRWISPRFCPDITPPRILPKLADGHLTCGSIRGWRHGGHYPGGRVDPRWRAQSEGKGVRLSVLDFTGFARRNSGLC